MSLRFLPANDIHTQTLQVMERFPPPQRLTSLSVSLPSVSFTDCGGDKVRLEVGEPSGFGVSEAGVISTSRRFSLAAPGKVEVVVYARDQRSQQVWKTKVHLHAAPRQVTQHDRRRSV